VALISFKGEHLVDHLTLTASLFDKTYGRSYAKLLANRFSIPEAYEDVYKLLKLTCLLHDIGKALQGYQLQKDHTSFPFHEVPSAFIFNTIVKQHFYKHLNLVTLCSIAILVHHQAMRNLNTLIEKHDDIIGTLSKKLGLPKSIDIDNDLEELSLAIKRHTKIDVYAEQVKELLAKLEIRDLSLLINGLVEQYLQTKISGTEISLWEPLIAAPLQLCDNLAASLLRPEGSPLSRKLAYEALRLLSSKADLLYLKKEELKSYQLI